MAALTKGIVWIHRPKLKSTAIRNLQILKENVFRIKPIGHQKKGAIQSHAST